MYYFLIIAAVVFSIVYFMPVVLAVNVLKDGKNDKITIEIKTLYGLMRLKSEIPYLVITFEGGKPTLKYKIEAANTRRSRLLAQFSKYFSLTEGQGLYKIYKANRKRIIPILKYISGKTRVRNFCLKLKLGAGDAAATGILYGVSWIAVGNIMTFTKGYLNIKEPHITIIPVFSRVQLNADFSCIISLKTGHIINAGIRAIPVLASILSKSRKD